MSVVLLSDDRPVARRHHECTQCGCSIAPGSRYRRVRYIYDGLPATAKEHEDCAALAHEIWVEAGCFSDEGVYLLEEEELELWRGEYPHPVCRVELMKRKTAIRHGRWEAHE